MQPTWGHSGAPIPVDKIVMRFDERTDQMLEAIRNLAQQRDAMEIKELSRDYSEGFESDSQEESPLKHRMRVDRN